MIRLYNRSILNKDNDTPALRDYDSARLALIRDQAYRFGLRHCRLSRVLGASEAFDGDFAHSSRLISQLIVWGMDDLRVSATEHGERINLIDLYGVERPIHVEEIRADAQFSGLVRIYNRILYNQDGATPALGVYDGTRQVLVCDQALAFGLAQWLLTGIPDGIEAFDGNFVNSTRLISQLILWGIGDLRVLAVAHDDYVSLLDLYAERVPLQVGEISLQAAKAQEADTPEVLTAGASGLSTGMFRSGNG